MIYLNFLNDFLQANQVLVIIILFVAILFVAYLIKKYILVKYQEPEVEQTPEEILQEELNRVLVTEEYKPIPRKKKKYDVEEEQVDENK